ncbi:transposase [Streptomyces sp. NPDC051546]|uniref:transposase n=1 Tax=Streptomyces sp. NPDC051546 TaxID=3365655 RepID=UPI003791DCB5
MHCPAGQASATWSPCLQGGLAKTVVIFSPPVCGPCPLRSKCTTSKVGRRQLALQPQGMHEALKGARARQETEGWKRDYAIRAGVEGRAFPHEGGHAVIDHAASVSLAVWCRRSYSSGLRWPLVECRRRVL